MQKYRFPRALSTSCNGVASGFNGGVTDPLVPYLPRLVLDWARDTPNALVREVDGSMVFVDLSGFTALSERLARAGREGAERITEIVDSTFTHLLEAAYADGGHAAEVRRRRAVAPVHG